MVNASAAGGNVESWSFMYADAPDERWGTSVTNPADCSRIVLRRATTDDARALSGFAARSFQETFGPESKPRDMEAYLAKAFSPAVQTAEIADAAATVILALDDRTSGLAGYAHLVARNADIELKRLYVDAPWKGRGLAARLMDRIFEECRRHGGDRLWLTVWVRNHRAMAFYEKVGFRVSGSETFMLGDDAQTDHVMEMAVPRAVARPSG
ncbi:GNAT family N-acetyltransferase [Labrys wisconsinensis]|uniref:GNAT superfamily N-acetyltransferase n=1 Tax=Labrys wisconsinensis TaxID=425677 RepID=A0ABU0JB89_9HYPH|nr:GNAT family N-acetyltransferase [Labrys wisconsinensis]MDQ0471534.1 GNAT superfamily N-acetyltransferase [Labrys wisconsinensis]